MYYVLIFKKNKPRSLAEVFFVLFCDIIYILR